MFKEEAHWIRTVLTGLQLKGCTAVNLGASTAEFRKIVQPHIHQEVIEPLERRGVSITHVDIKKAEGVDIVADITSADFPRQICRQFDLALCTNMLEHVSDIPMVLRNVISVVKSGGYILLTVPRRYPLHFDPIDNGFRPTPNKLASLVLEQTRGYLLCGEVIVIKDPKYYSIKQSRFPIWGYRQRIRYHLGFYYQTTGILIKKTE
ncbi:MAG: class I SAM-dependent methyltransferase [Thermaurantimonas sp.]|uniref:class I SAM-dependent methyltransferase n=1 Tax=Thermaurantimonas sp. TaxID=2681568 RepID=UPI003919138D